MIKVIAGAKGTGKTALLVDELNIQAAEDHSNIVCIIKGNRFDQLLKHKIRLVDIEEYPVKGYDQLLSFIAGITSKDYDITHLYIDSIPKVAGQSDLNDLVKFLNQLENFIAGDPLSVIVSCSIEDTTCPEELKKYF